MENYGVNDEALAPYYANAEAKAVLEERFGAGPLGQFDGLKAYPVLADDQAAIVNAHLYLDTDPFVYPVAMDFVKVDGEWKIGRPADYEAFKQSRIADPEVLGPSEAFLAFEQGQGIPYDSKDFSYIHPEFAVPGKSYIQSIYTWQDEAGDVYNFFMMSNGEQEAAHLEAMTLRIEGPAGLLVEKAVPVDLEVPGESNRTHPIHIPKEDLALEAFSWEGAETYYVDYQGT